MKIFITLLFCLPFFALAQKFTLHTVAQKESLTSIARKYNMNGRDLAKYNDLDYDKGLTLGQVIKVPITSVTAHAIATEPPVVKEPVKNVENGTPIYHIVAPKETLYGISVKYGKVPVADLKRWNNLTTDGVNEGAKLIVGYQGKANEVVKAAPKPIKETPVKEVPVKKEVIAAKEPEQIEEIKEQVNYSTKTETPPVQEKSNKNFNGGIFKSVYASQVKKGNAVDETGLAGVFKSTSGWEDGKYYCLHNSATPGTILKITNETNGKTVYAKVLDMVIPDIKQNNGLLLRLSNAAADELGVIKEKFDCSLSYSK